MSKVKAIFGFMRIPFLLLNPACVAVGVGTAYWQTGNINGWHVLLILVGAVASHISVNAFNEYFDFRSKLDTRTQRTPFSGGSGTLPANPEYENLALILAIGSTGIVAIIGVFFIWQRGWELLPLGLIGLLLVITYTIWFVYHPVLCLLAPGLGFGLLMVLGTHFALTGTYTWTAFIASMLPTTLVSNLLLLNQFPDMEADRSIGRRHFPILIGRKNSSIIFGALLLLGYGSILFGILSHLLPVWCVLTFVTLIPAWQTFQGALLNAEDIPALLPSMGMNVIINLTAPLLLAIGLFLGG